MEINEKHIGNAWVSQHIQTKKVHIVLDFSNIYVALRPQFDLFWAFSPETHCTVAKIEQESLESFKDGWINGNFRFFLSFFRNDQN